jgi:hypothetical protein
VVGEVRLVDDVSAVVAFVVVAAAAGFAVAGVID